MRIVIFGANGQTGRLLTRRVLDAGHTAVAVTRNPDGFPFADARLVVGGADVRDASSLVSVVDGADAVLSTLGVPFSVRAIDTYSAGIRNVVAAMRKTAVRRLVVVSSTGAYHYPNRVDTPFALRIVEPVITRTIGKTTYDDQRRMETIVRDSGVDWTIVRPSGLFDLPEPTNYVAGEVDPIGGFTARIDLADYMTKLAGDSSAAGKTVVVSTTENTPTMWQMVRREAFKSA
ncbi:NAD(P)-dependent oxidoreductase [Mycobacterium sp.]|uniref:NAD(P)-dependent oxidoreductase n=1 Tax=Mycobacterium sp. TaxID=1785 RepID=UPI002D86A5AA|nr:NAD(P)H-binding protein [Mycobacterium sp.]